MRRTRDPVVLLLGVVALSCGDDGRLDDQPVLAMTCVVSRVADGDTITCTDGIRIRLLGIDSPELDQAPFGDQSRVALEALLTPGQSARLELDVETRDDFGRTLAYLWVDDSLINEAIVRQGWALAFIIAPNDRYEDRLRAAEAAAMQAGAGHWGTGGFACRPVEHRQGNC